MFTSPSSICRSLITWSAFSIKQICFQNLCEKYNDHYTIRSVLLPGNTRRCGECTYGSCSVSCGSEGEKKGEKQCWLVSGLTGNEIRNSRRNEECTDTCNIPCPIDKCEPCRDLGPCSETCDADGIKDGKQDCWKEDALTGDEIIGSRHERACNKTCHNLCTCGPCGSYSQCSESCGAAGTKGGTKDCWVVDGATNVEIEGSRHQETCTDTCENDCTCGPCEDFGPCSESCGAEGTKAGQKDCWAIDETTRREIPSSRHKETCTDKCENLCKCEDRCGNFGPCSESCDADGTKTGDKDCWAIDEITHREIPSSRHKEMCTDPCHNLCTCDSCGQFGQCSESCGAAGTKDGTKDCWVVDGATNVEIEGSRHQETCTDTCENDCTCGPCEDFGPCSESCGAEGTKAGQKECWAIDEVTHLEIPNSRYKKSCTDKCENLCKCEDSCGNFGPCSESCDADGTKTGDKDCWAIDEITHIEIPSSRHKEMCTDPCHNLCTCDSCGQFGQCSESCGAAGTKGGTKDCWVVDGATNVEINGSRYQETCTDTCENDCTCGPCEDFGPCSESCGAEGTKAGQKDCWAIDEVTHLEIPNSRYKKSCTDKCENLCKCEDSCGNFGPCSESCDADGTKTGDKDCWAIDEITHIEIPSSRHKEMCTDPCHNLCTCDSCGQFGQCSESCGAAGTKHGTKDCWVVDGATNVEIEGSRHQETCTDTCENDCTCGPCEDFGPCSESCGAEGTKVGQKDCWAIDETTRREIPSSRHKETCTDKCENLCKCEDGCGNFGPCSESCGADGTKTGDKDCWAIDEVTHREIPSSRHKETCTDNCFTNCPTTTTACT